MWKKVSIKKEGETPTRLLHPERRSMAGLSRRSLAPQPSYQSPREQALVETAIPLANKNQQTKILEQQIYEVSNTVVVQSLEQANVYQQMQAGQGLDSAAALLAGTTQNHNAIVIQTAREIIVQKDQAAPPQLIEQLPAQAEQKIVIEQACENNTAAESQPQPYYAADNQTQFSKQPNQVGALVSQPCHSKTSFQYQAGFQQLQLQTAAFSQQTAGPQPAIYLSVERVEQEPTVQNLPAWAESRQSRSPSGNYTSNQQNYLTTTASNQLLGYPSPHTVNQSWESAYPPARLRPPVYVVQMQTQHDLPQPPPAKVLSINNNLQVTVIGVSATCQNCHQLKNQLYAKSIRIQRVREAALRSKRELAELRIQIREVKLALVERSKHLKSAQFRGYSDMWLQLQRTANMLKARPCEPQSLAKTTLIERVPMHQRVNFSLMGNRNESLSPPRQNLAMRVEVGSLAEELKRSELCTSRVEDYGRKGAIQQKKGTDYAMFREELGYKRYEFGQPLAQNYGFKQDLRKGIEPATQRQNLRKGPESAAAKVKQSKKQDTGQFCKAKLEEQVKRQDKKASLFQGQIARQDFRIGFELDQVKLQKDTKVGYELSQARLLDSRKGLELGQARLQDPRRNPQSGQARQEDSRKATDMSQYNVSDRVRSLLQKYKRR